MTILDFMKQTFKTKYYIRPRLYFKDGFNMSIQGGDDLHYCIPRNIINEYERVEIGYINEREPLLEPYISSLYDESDSGYYTESIYPYTPIEVAEEICKKHGGIDIDKTNSKISDKEDRITNHEQERI